MPKVNNTLYGYYYLALGLVAYFREMFWVMLLVCIIGACHFLAAILEKKNA